MIPYSAILDVPRELAWYVAGLLNDERYWRRTRRGRRVLTCYRQAVLVLRWFLDATRLRRLACDNRISLSTAYRYLHEGIDVLADAAPDLHEVLAQQRRQQAPYLILDGTLIPTDRVRTPSEKGNDLWYCGQHHIHGGNIQFLATPQRISLMDIPRHAGLATRHHRRPRTLPRRTGRLPHPDPGRQGLPRRRHRHPRPRPQTLGRPIRPPRR